MPLCTRWGLAGAALGPSYLWRESGGKGIRDAPSARMLSFHGRKPAAAAHDGAAAAKAGAGAGARAGTAAGSAPACEMLSAGATAAGASAAPAKAAHSAHTAQASGAGASGGAEASVVAPPASVKTHASVAGWSDLPAVKLRVIDECFALGAQYTAAAAAASDPARRDVLKVLAAYCARFPDAVVSETKRAKRREDAGAGEKVKFPRADLKARGCARACAARRGAVADKWSPA